MNLREVGIGEENLEAMAEIGLERCKIWIPFS